MASNLPTITRGTDKQIAQATAIRRELLARFYCDSDEIPRQVRLVLVGFRDATWWLEHEQNNLLATLRSRLGAWAGLLDDARRRSTYPQQPSEEPKRELGGDLEAREWIFEASFYPNDDEPMVVIRQYHGDEMVGDEGPFWLQQWGPTAPTDGIITWAIKKLGYSIPRGASWEEDYDGWTINVVPTHTLRA